MRSWVASISGLIAFATTAGYECRSGDQDQPRASGWESPVDGDLAHRNRLGLEVWYYDRAPSTSPPSILNQSTKKRLGTADDRLGLFEGKFRVIGQEIGSGRIYTGRITAKRDEGILKIRGTINGKVIFAAKPRLETWFYDW